MIQFSFQENFQTALKMLGVALPAPEEECETNYQEETEYPENPPPSLGDQTSVIASREQQPDIDPTDSLAATNDTKRNCLYTSGSAITKRSNALLDSLVRKGSE